MTTDDDDDPGESPHGFLSHEPDSEALWQALTDGGLAVSADNMRALLEQVADAVTLSAEEEAELVRRIVAGRRAADALSDADDAHRRELIGLRRDGDRAKQELAEANLDVLVVLAKRYTGRGAALPDLLEVGKIALSQAADRFDGGKGYRFSVYATWWIRRAMTRAMTA